jgi:hypothetical protein
VTKNLQGRVELTWTKKAERLITHEDPSAKPPYAWVNLFPLAPENPPGNPAGVLYEAEAAQVASVLEANVRALDAKIVIALVGPFWWPVADSIGLDQLKRLRAASAALRGRGRPDMGRRVASGRREPSRLGPVPLR